MLNEESGIYGVNMKKINDRLEEEDYEKASELRDEIKKRNEN